MGLSLYYNSSMCEKRSPVRGCFECDEALMRELRGI